MVKILLVEGKNMEAGGVETYLLNVLSQIRRNNLVIDVLVPGKIVSETIADRFRSFECRILELHMKQQGSLKETMIFINKLKRYLSKNKYDVIHVNTGNLRVEAVCLALAKQEGVATRIAHSHNVTLPGSTAKEIVRKAFRAVILQCATDFLACSPEAADTLVGEKHCGKVQIAKNGINADDYRFDPCVREKIRKENGWDGRFVVGCIARIALQKNQLFMLQVVKKMALENAKVLLAMVGKGDDEYEQQVKEEVKELDLDGNVQFLGERNDINELVQGMDLHVLPSNWEGLGIVNIEAQASGLRCVCSDRVSREADVTGLVEFIPLEKGPDFWADRLARYNNGYERKDTADMIKEKGYDVNSSAQIIGRIYNRPLKGGVHSQ